MSETAVSPAAPSRLVAVGALIVGVSAASTAAILIRIGGQTLDCPSVALAAGRLTVATLILSAVMVARQSLAPSRPAARVALGVPNVSPTASDYCWAPISGVFLALHFGAWFASLAYTSVASSAVFVSTTPIFVALIGWLWLSEPLHRRTMLGIAVAIAGSIVIALADEGAVPFAGSAPWLGNALAVLGAVAAAGYLLIGRRVRRRMDLLPYIWITYGVAAAGLLLGALVERHLTGRDWPLTDSRVWAVIVGLAVGPQLLGHSSLNYALKALPATFVAVALLGEPIGSMILAIIVLGETPQVWQFGGCACLLLGIFLAIRAPRASRPAGENPS